jgi:hypothetical protein
VPNTKTTRSYVLFSKIRNFSEKVIGSYLLGALLYGIYRNEDHNKIVTYFLNEFGETSRTKAAIKKKLIEIERELRKYLNITTSDAVEQQKMSILVIF